MDLIKQSLSILDNENIYIRRDYIDRLREYIETNNVIVVQWQRRVWKSFVILWLLKETKISNNKIFYLNKEIDEEDQIADTKQLSKLYKDFVSKYNEPTYIIVDEIQDIQDWEKFIRARYAEKKFKIIISWSNSKLLSWELSTYLTWRQLDFFVYPFSYKEFLDLKKYENNDNNFNEYLIYWWLPEWLFIENSMIRNNYIKWTLNTLLLKDIVKRYKIQDISVLEKTIKFLWDNVWSITSLTNITKYLKNEWFAKLSVNTLSAYIKYLENAFIIHTVSRYDLKWKKILEHKEKYYFTDIWIRNSLWYNLKNDIGKLLENLVFLKLKEEWYDVYVWALYDREIDFVAKKNDDIVYIQVAYLMQNEETKKREFWNLYKINWWYQKMVISLDPIATWNSDGIKWINVKDFLLSGL